jgi:hypothetical protein
MQYMGVNVSPSEAQLLEFDRDVPSMDAFPANQRAYVAERLHKAALLKRDIYRIADWKAQHNG